MIDLDSLLDFSITIAEDCLRLKDDKESQYLLDEHIMPGAYGNCVNCGLSWRKIVGSGTVEGKPKCKNKTGLLF